MRRILLITLSLAAVGVVLGAVLGALSLAVIAIVNGVPIKLRDDVGIVGAGGQVGAVLGAVLAPIAAWSLMRSVPLWRAIGEPALGTVIGAIVGASIAGPITRFLLPWGAIGAVVGFLVAAIRLRIAFRASQVEPSMRPANEEL